ncbi:restriction endonuclease subunit S [Swingsia samuiensis]|uniref:Restriction endonuclease subunit S n=1 Tax=Swingsia samuiensis TaxID=1293412 RepID=A0A4Y6UK09_9PROT|nr:restriction endonuclease subunit S [Swingsia samuiensis]QDH16978.1 restriction endonuclease subunit S [Swingsia samuiensis]
MTNWQESTLESCIEVLLDYRGKSPPKSPVGIPVLSAKVVKTTGLQQPIEQKIHVDYYTTWMVRGLPRAGDVVMTTEGPMGEVIQLNEETAKYALGQRIVCLRGKDGTLDNTFLRYLLSSPSQQKIIESYSTGTTVPGISQKSLRSIPIFYPSFEKQKCIGSLLSALDDKIDLNRRMNETLEGMARALFKDWFVDFGPTRAKMAGQKPYLAQDIWDMFPNQLDDDGKPVGWVVVSLKDLASLCKETVNPSAFPDKKFEHYSLPAFDNGKTPVCEVGISIKSGKFIVARGSILLSKLNPEIQRVWLTSMQKQENTKVCSTEFLVLLPHAELLRSLVYCICVSEKFQEQIVSMVTGTSKSHQRVKPSEVILLNVSVGSKAMFEQFSQITGRFFEKIEQNSNEISSLAQMRDLLLPKLMSGEIHIKDAEKMVGDIL